MWSKSCVRSICPPPVLVGHSMGSRVVIEAALQASDHAAGVVLVDGSQFAPAMGAILKEALATPDGFANLTRRWFEDMFTPSSDATVAASVVERAECLPREIGEKVLLDLVRYDVNRLPMALGDLRVPVMAIQTTYSNERRERRPMIKGQTTPYLDMLRSRIPSVRIEIIPDTGHFPQIDERHSDKCLDRQLHHHAADALSGHYRACESAGGDLSQNHGWLRAGTIGGTASCWMGGHPIKCGTSRMAPTCMKAHLSNGAASGHSNGAQVASSAIGCASISRVGQRARPRQPTYVRTRTTKYGASCTRSHVETCFA